jgi:putative transposase
VPRTRRLIPVDAAIHVVNRGNNRQYILSSDEDKKHYCCLLRELKEENKITIFHYCLMDNHPHLILWLNNESKISKFMKQLNLCYFNYYRKKYGYSGHLWEGRFKSNIIDTDSYLLQCGKYIELNPVRAGIVDSPEKYRFSSFRHYAIGGSDPIVTSSPAYLGMADSPEKRRKQYIEFVVDSSIINKEVLNRQLFVGSEIFIRELQECYQIRNTRLKRGRPGKEEK